MQKKKEQKSERKRLAWSEARREVKLEMEDGHRWSASLHLHIVACEADLGEK